MEKFIEEDIQSIQEVKHTKPRAYILMVFKVFAYKTPSSLVSGESDEDFLSSDEEEVTHVLEPPTIVDEKIATIELESEEKEDNEDKLIMKNKGIERKLEEGDAKVQKRIIKRLILDESKHKRNDGRIKRCRW